jgi:hypothetical protein
MSGERLSLLRSQSTPVRFRLPAEPGLQLDTAIRRTSSTTTAEVETTGGRCRLSESARGYIAYRETIVHSIEQIIKADPEV